jgi:FkbM family methyltransferase
VKRSARLVQWFNHACPWHQPKHSLAKWAAKRLDRGGGPRVFDGIQGGLRMRLDPASSYERSILLNAADPMLLDVYRSILRPGDVVIDAGANIGHLALAASRLVGPGGKVHAFECGPRALERLRENIELNGAGNVVVVDRACWDSEGTSTLYDFDEKEIDLPSMGRRSDRAVAKEIEIRTVKIDDVVKEPVRLVKMDVEGAELAALRGAERVLFGDPRPDLIIELNPKTSRAFGYHPVDLVDHILARSPGASMTLVKARRTRPVTREGLERILREDEGKNHNVWFSGRG